MGAFESTLYRQDHAQQRQCRAPLSTVVPALSLPVCNAAIQAGRKGLIGRDYQRAQPQMGAKCLARFVRSMHQRGWLSDTELSHSLSKQPLAGLFHLSHLAATRIGQRTRIPKESVDTKALCKRLSGYELPRSAVVTLARAGDRLGLFNATTLRQRIGQMDAPGVQFAPFWWEQLQGECSSVPGETPAWAADLSVEFHDHTDGVVISLTSHSPVVNCVTLPADNTANGILVRDALLALFDALTYTSHGYTPADCLGYHLGVQDDALQLRLELGGVFTAARLREHLCEQIGIEPSDDLSPDDLSDVIEDYRSAYTMPSLEGWMEVMAILSDEQHWLHRCINDHLPHPNTGGMHERQLNGLALHDYASQMWRSVREQLGVSLPQTLVAAESLLDLIKAKIGQPEPARSSWDADMTQFDESRPMEAAFQIWADMSGGEVSERTAINTLFREVLPDEADQMFRDGTAYTDAYMILADAQDDSAPALKAFLQGIDAQQRLMAMLDEATAAEIPKINVVTQ